jgi:hypothetical protein
MKHMSVFLDLFILLDTVAIVFRGGLDDSKKTEHPFSKAIMDHSRRMGPQPSAPGQPDLRQPYNFVAH